MLLENKTISKNTANSPKTEIPQLTIRKERNVNRLLPQSKNIILEFSPSKFIFIFFLSLSSSIERQKMGKDSHFMSVFPKIQYFLVYSFIFQTQILPHIKSRFPYEQTDATQAQIALPPLDLPNITNSLTLFSKLLYSKCPKRTGGDNFIRRI